MNAVVGELGEFTARDEFEAELERLECEWADARQSLGLACTENLALRRAVRDIAGIAATALGLQLVSVPAGMAVQLVNVDDVPF